MPRLIVLIIFVSLSLSLNAETTITYQGQLQDSSGPYTGLVEVEFRLYDSQTGSNQVGPTINKSDVSVEDGLFQVELDFGAVYDAQRWLEVEVDGNILSPRQRIASTPVAVHAISGAEDTLAGLDCSIDEITLFDGSEWVCASGPMWSESASNSVFTSSNVGIGLTDPAAQLQVSGAVAVGVDANQASGSMSFVSGGSSAANANTASGNQSFVAGGRRNEAGGADSFVAGGLDNQSQAFGAVVAGGQDNLAEGQFSFASGQMSIASGNNSFIGGGENNLADAVHSVVLGGRENEARAEESFVGGGRFNEASNEASAVLAGAANTASGPFSTILGGVLNEAAGQYSVAAGRRAKALDDGSFVWADDQSSDFSTTGQNQFLIRAAGGVGIGTTTPSGALEVVGGDTIIGGWSQEERLGVGTDSPWNTLHVVSNEEENPFRVMVGNNNPGSTSIRAYAHQGVAIGNSWSSDDVPDRGLRVHGASIFDSVTFFGNVALFDSTTFFDSPSFWTDLNTSTTSPDGIILQNTNDQIWAIHTSSQWLRFNTSEAGEDSQNVSWVNLSGEWNSNSDERLKTDIHVADPALQKVKELSVVNYRFKGNNADSDLKIGLIAQDVAPVFPELVSREKDNGYWGINYAGFSVVAIKAIQEQQALIEHQNKALETLRLEQSQQTKEFEMQIERNAVLEARLAKLEQKVQHNTKLEDRLAKLEALLLEDRQVAGAPQH